MTWYIVAFACGVFAAMAWIALVEPWASRLWNYIKTKARQIRDLPW